MNFYLHYFAHSAVRSKRIHVGISINMFDAFSILQSKLKLCKYNSFLKIHLLMAIIDLLRQCVCFSDWALKFELMI